MAKEGVWENDNLENCLKSTSAFNFVGIIPPVCGDVIEQYWYCYEDGFYETINKNISFSATSLDDKTIAGFGDFGDKSSEHNCEEKIENPLGNVVSNWAYWQCIFKKEYNPQSAESGIFDKRYIGAYYDKISNRYRGYQGVCDPKFSLKAEQGDNIALMKCNVKPISCDVWRSETKSYETAQRVSGSLSLIASSVVIYIMSRSRSKFSTTLNRLLLALNISDMMSSTWFIVGPLALPKQHYFVHNAIGTEFSCKIQTFLLASGLFTSPYYTLSVCLYYLSIIKYKARDDWIRSKLEPWFLGLPLINIVLFLVVSITDSDSSNSIGVVCIYKSSTLIFVSQACILLTQVAIQIAMTMMWLEVRKVEGKVNVFRRSLQMRPAKKRSSIRLSLTDENFKRSRVIFFRALMYSAAFFAVWICEIIRAGWYYFTPEKSQPFALIFVAKIMFPLQGFFNFFIFLHPRVIAARESRKKPSWCKAILMSFSQQQHRRYSQSSVAFKGKSVLDELQKAFEKDELDLYEAEYDEDHDTSNGSSVPRDDDLGDQETSDSGRDGPKRGAVLSDAEVISYGAETTADSSHMLDVSETPSIESKEASFQC